MRDYGIVFAGEVEHWLAFDAFGWIFYYFFSIVAAKSHGGTWPIACIDRHAIYVVIKHSEEICHEVGAARESTDRKRFGL